MYVAIEKGTLGRGVEARGRLIEDEEQRLASHHAAGQGELLPLPGREVSAAAEAASERRLESVGQLREQAGGARAFHRRAHRLPILHLGEAPDTDRLSGE